MLNVESNNVRGFTKGDYQRFAPMVRRIAMRLGNRLPNFVDINDLVAAGWVGVLEVLSRVDARMPEGEVDALVSCRTRGAILDHLRTLDPASRRVRRESRKVSRVVATLSTRLGRKPTEQEIADGLGMPLDQYRTLEAEVDRLATVCAGPELAKTMASSMPSPEGITEHNLRVAQVTKAIEQLPERMRLVMTMMYQDDRPQFEVAEVLGVSAARVCQIHREAMSILRRELQVA